MTHIVTAIVPEIADALSIFKDLGKNKKVETTTLKERGDSKTITTDKKKIHYVCDKCLENKTNGKLNTTTGVFICDDCLNKKKGRGKKQ